MMKLENIYFHSLCVFGVLVLLPPGGVSLTRNVGQDAVFMWNRTSGSIKDAKWGLYDNVQQDIIPSFIYINKFAKVPVPSGDLDTPAASRYKGRVFWVGDILAGRAWFKITNLNINDTNQYGVRVRDVNDAVSYYKMNLIVAETPRFQPQPPLTKTIPEGQHLSVPCAAIGPPTPDITWVRMVGPVIKSTGTGSATLRIPNIRRDQNGTYECQARNNANEIPVTAQTVVVVYYPPQVTPSPASITVEQSKEIILSCTADGNPPPSISWTKADGVIKAGHTVAGGTLRIPDAIKTDAGKYICTANNTYDRRQHTDTATATVEIEYPPSITSGGLYNQTVNETESLIIKCGAEGNPPPTIKWKTPTGSVHTGNVYKIPSVSRSHAGTYTCTASNGIGREAVASIQVTVQYPPSIDASQSDLTSKSWDGNSIRLRCTATGLPTPRISWYKPTNQKITTGVNIVPGGSEVTVLTTADQGDYGQYKCQATNVLGSDEHVINVTRLFPPNCSSFAMAEGDIEASSIHVRWNKPDYDGGSPVTGYKVQINTNPLQEKYTSDTNVKFTGLTKNTKYKVEVFARNIAGYGRPCIKIITTKKLGKPAAPEIKVSLNQTRSAELSIKLTWTKPDNNGKEITKYTIYMKEDDSAEFAKIHDVLDPAVLEYTVTKNMEYGKTYEIVVTAWNELGESEYDDTMVKNITMPEAATIPVKNANGTSKSLGGINSKCLVGAGVTAGILVASLVLNVLQFLYIWKKIRPNENRRKAENERDANQRKEKDQVYDNAFELKENTLAGAVLASGATPAINQVPEYEAVQLQQGRQKEPSKMFSPPTASTQPSSLYQELSTSGPAQVNTGPVYEPLRKTVPLNANQTNIYQPLGLRNQSSDYQSLHIDASDSMI